MKILYLGTDFNAPLLTFFINQGIDVVIKTDKVYATEVIEIGPELLISYNYKYLIDKEVIELYEGRIINLHISLLPWNRGAQPNFWSFWDNTPKGVSIHYIDDGIDTGDIIVQKELEFNDDETLKSTYDILQREIQKLFIENWPIICTNNNNRTPQVNPGSFHFSKDIGLFWKLVESRGGWNITIRELKQLKSQFDGDALGGYHER